MRRPITIVQARRLTSPLMLFVLFTLSYLSGEFVRPISGKYPTDASSGVGEQVIAIQLIGIAIYGLAFLGIAMRRVRIPGPSFLLAAACCGFAVLSAAWSADPMASLPKSLALSGSLLFAYLFVVALSPDDRIRALRLYAYVFLITNLIAVAIPGYGIHNLGDSFYTEHAGRWRGLFFHKNSLGQQSGIVCLILIMSFGGLYGWRRSLHIAALLATFVIIAFSGSAQLMIALPCAVLAYFFYLAVPNSRVRIVAIALLSVGAAMFFLTGPFDYLLGATADLVGRDPTMSNRTFIWNAAINNGAPYWLAGRGYKVSWTAGVGDAVKAVVGLDVGHPHDGYIQVWLDVGVIGLGLVIALLGYTLARVSARSARGLDRNWLAFSFAFLVYYIIINVVGSDLLEYNNLLWVMLLVIAFNVDLAPAGGGRIAPSLRRAGQFARQEVAG